MTIGKSLVTAAVLVATSLTMAGEGRRGSLPAPLSQQPVYVDPAQPIDRRVDDLISKLTTMGREEMRKRDVPFLQGSSEHFGIDTIGLPSVLADAELTASRRVEKQHFVSPARQQLVDEPSLPTSLDGYPRRRCFGTEHRLERFD